LRYYERMLTHRDVCIRYHDVHPNIAQEE
jgi:hypothetical protein